MRRSWQSRPVLYIAQGAIVAVEDPQRRFFGLQYHPEVHHTKRGRDMLRHFLFDVAEVPADWKMESVLEEEMAKIADLVGNLLYVFIVA